MTDRAAPGAQGSHVRNVEYGEMGGAPAPFIVPFDGNPSRSAQRWGDLANPEEASSSSKRGPFGINHDSGSNSIRIYPGEGYVDGWFATDAEKTVDISPYEGEEVTVVVGWDPDAVYSSDVHDSREEADSVIADLERNVDDDVPYIPIYRFVVASDGEGGYIAENYDVVDLRPIGRPVETLPANEDSFIGEETAGPGVNLLRGRPTAHTGGVASGPIEATEDRDGTIVADVPVSNDLAAGDEVSYVLQAGGEPVLKVYAEADGNGGVQNLRVDSMGNQLQGVSGDTTADSMTADPESGAEDGYIEVVLDGSTYQIPIYAE